MPELLRHPVRLTWLNQSWNLYYRVMAWCRQTYGAPGDRYDVHHLLGQVVIDFEHGSDRVLFLLKWGEYHNEL